MTYRLPNGKNTRGVKVESKYMTLEKYAATLKVGDEVTIEYYSISGYRLKNPHKKPLDFTQVKV